MTLNKNKGKFNIRHLPFLLKETFAGWKKEDPWRMSVVVAFYVLLSMPGLLVIILNAVGAAWGEDLGEGRFTSQISEVIGQEAAHAIQVIIEASQEQKSSAISTLFGIGTLIIGSTGAFYTIQISLNQVWGVKPAPGAGLKRVFLSRLVSFAFVLLIGILLLISFLITALLSVLNDYIRQTLPDFTLYLAYAFNEILSFAVIAVLFALMYRYLPDAHIRWKTVWIGALITALLFISGKFLMGWYFGRINPASAFGAAGSMVLLLLWVAYSAFIFFFGAEFTFIYSRHYGWGVRPKPHAVRVEIKEVIIEHGKRVSKTE